MLDTNKKNLIDYLLKNGKDKSWTKLAKEFGIEQSEQARTTWLHYRQKQGLIGASSMLQEVAEVVVESGKAIEEKIVAFQEDMKTNKAEITINVNQEIKSLEELIEKTNIDTTKWQITKWIQNFWNNRYQVKAWLEPIVVPKSEVFANNFVEFLKEYKPAPRQSPVLTNNQREKACIVINKQDAHLNKLDIHGDNDLEKRFLNIEKAVITALAKASIANNLEKVMYIVGSDEFNSEWTSATTKFTPQQNAINFHESFQTICDHEVSVINAMLRTAANIEVIYVAGNHDEYIGWHMITWLQAFYRNETRVTFDVSPDYRKYKSYGVSLFMLNHGDAIKPEKLASIFPMEAKDAWSEHLNYYIFTGDKHNTLTKDLNGILFYQLPALSTAKSSWDDKNGYTCSKPELTSFVISKDDGITDIYKSPL